MLEDIARVELFAARYAVTAPVEGWISAQENVHDDSYAPEIATFVVLFWSQYFGSDVVGSVAGCLEVFKVLLNFFGKPKVRYF